MFALGPIGFAAPWLLLGLVALPILWLILRAVPPAPIRRRFPGVALLLGLTDEESTSDRTPWWLLLLRVLAVAAVIIGLAGPVLNPQDRVSGSGPVLILADSGWAGAPQFPRRAERMRALIEEAGQAGRPLATLRITDPATIAFQSADVALTRLPGLVPEPWSPGPDEVARAIEEISAAGAFDTYWMSDGLDYEGREQILSALRDAGDVRIFQTPISAQGLVPATYADGVLTLRARRSEGSGAETMQVQGFGRDPVGIERILVAEHFAFAEGELQSELALSLPAELRARITRFELAGGRSAGAVALTDDSLQRREIALFAGREDREGLTLLSPLHYLQQALEPTAEILDGALLDVIPANPDVIVLADVATLAPAEEAAIVEWVEAGGMLLRFAGPRVAASDLSRTEEDTLMPVRLRAGGRSVGGAMSWGEPKTLAPFAEESPFHGLAVPDDVTVTSQVMAQPDPTLADRVVAQLTDGTPLVTRKRMGGGQIVLFHVTANADWSTLPLSGLFVQMLERLSVTASGARPTAEELEGTVWKPIQVLDGFGDLRDAGTMAGVPGPDLVSGTLGRALPPGLYEGESRRLARNVMDDGTLLVPAGWPDDVRVDGLDTAEETPLQGWLLALALALLSVDIVASLGLSGRLVRAALVGVALALPGLPEAQGSDDFALQASAGVVLAHVLTGDERLDRMAEQGLAGLSDVLFFRTSVEPDAPMGVDLETDELSLFPFLYWPISADQPIPSDIAYAKLNDYLRTGGLILFDTRDADVSGFGGGSPESRRLQRIAAPLDIPPLELLPDDHVLTRTFYLLQDFPGRHNSRDVWVEAAPQDAELIEGMPFRNLNDNVTPVIIGGNDWAAAWATDENGVPLYPVGRGYAGERQREVAYRFGVNLIMHVLTGNYKSDQVHVPALLDRLGQ
ncbi:N-terminal double-transmembrane domain-containing protein [Poseidonocella pacifica]|uniref:N-terminal double-transmembrane domain-containing protein n=1 Tax=Poseidonocella pacifica TaxID=871651 RepID=A0A1I0WEF5_9RHOB|nr:DUF4159 domain-containing protein [Poseidonocella pacifica]SFA86306.1 N-terminal double-transmembrane domain-containing protein [Poseidonocella pacifica]